MTEKIEEFCDRIGFHALNQAAQIRALAYYMHEVRGVPRLVTADFRKCFEDLHLQPPNISYYLSYQSDPKKNKSRSFLRDKAGFRLEGRVRAELQKKFGADSSKIAIRSLLLETLEKVKDPEQRVFADEAIACFAAGAFRSAIVMTWNLAFDHFTRWLMSDPERLAAFNSSLSVKYPSEKLHVTQMIHFEDMREFQAIESAQHAKVLTKNIAEIMKEKLKKRNAAAHPSSIKVSQAQVEDVITDLINNVIEKLQ